MLLAEIKLLDRDRATVQSKLDTERQALKQVQSQSAKVIKRFC
jgi:hypothetical protein